jgi:methenyltetrahydrofolate cyclohydrolase
MSDMSLNTFLDELASGAPTPGGGGAAAVMGAMGAALVAMVCNLTIGKKGYEAVDADMRQLLSEAEDLRARLTRMVAEDVAAFNTLMAAYKLPKETAEDKAARTVAIQAGLKVATDAPLACAKAAAEVLRLARRATDLGNVNVISDSGVAAIAGTAALRSAVLNVNVNAPQIKDELYVRRTMAELNTLMGECAGISEAVQSKVQARLT